MNITRVRSHRYPKAEEGYINTTYYDENEEYLDLGFQQLKKLHVDFYPEFFILKKLFVDHNRLRELPNPKYLPYIEELTCSANNLETIPYYPNLKFLNIAHNYITNCDQYHNSGLTYFDCSYNKGFKLNFNLPNCKQLYASDTDMTSIDLHLTPKLEILDCGNNRLRNIMGGLNLVEVNLQYNDIVELPHWPNLVRLMASNNKIKKLKTYDNLVSVIISYNNISKIYDQPSLKKIIANNNCIYEIGKMPELELVDLSHNNISFFTMPKKAEYISLQFNPITKLVFSDNALQSIKELQVNFETYKYIYSKYYYYFDAVNVKTNEGKLEQMLKKLSNVFDDSIARMIFRQFNNINFKDREAALYKITLRIYWYYFSNPNAKTIEDLVSTPEFKQLLKNMTDFYYKTIVITLYFNGYFD